MNIQLTHLILYPLRTEHSYIQNWENLKHGLITQLYSTVLSNCKANITELHIRPLKFHIMLTEKSNVMPVVTSVTCGINRCRTFHGDEGGVVFLSFHGRWASSLSVDHHPFRHQAGTWAAFLSATGPDWICTSKFISFGIQLKQLQRSN
jgi:hypothetical protein